MVAKEIEPVGQENRVIISVDGEKHYIRMFQYYSGRMTLYSAKGLLMGQKSLTMKNMQDWDIEDDDDQLKMVWFLYLAFDLLGSGKEESTMKFYKQRNLLS